MPAVCRSQRLPGLLLVSGKEGEASRLFELAFERTSLAAENGI